VPSGDVPGPEVSDASIPEEVLREFFGDSFAVLQRFVELLRDEGQRRGLIGPREAGRLWVRHVGNCAAVVPF
jgi:16S rRNA (guanine527-N7)-methyltransferase